MNCLKLFLVIPCLSLNYGANAISKDSNPEDDIVMHLHRLTARHEMHSQSFDYDLFSFSIRILFDNAERSGNVSKMASIINFFKEEDVILRDLGELRARLFDKVRISQLKYPHLAKAFKGS